MKTIELPYSPRAGQALLAKLVDKKQYFVAVCHRGFGKSIFSISLLIKWALKKKGVYAYVAPEKQQGKKITWDTIKEYLAKIPQIKFNEMELAATFPNGSKLYLEGAEKPDRLRGLHLSGIVLDEVADMPVETWEAVVFPALQVNNGKALFIGTPKGDNIFKEFYLKGQDPDLQHQWGSVLIDVYSSGVFSEEHINMNIKPNQPAALFNQEYLCRFDAKFDGSYYGGILLELEARGQINQFAYDPHKAVYAAWDIGFDGTAIWLAQLDTERQLVYLIDFISETGKDLPYYINALKQKPYIYATHYLPFDADARSMETGNSRTSLFKAHGFKTYTLPKSPDVNSDIAQVQTFLYKCRFDYMSVKKGLEHLKNYSASYNRLSGQYTKVPKHDKHSHAADSFRYLVFGLATELKSKRTHDITRNMQELVVHKSPLTQSKDQRHGYNRF